MGKQQGLTDAQFNRLIKKTAKQAALHMSLTGEVAAECVRRYGCTWSDIDCDAIVDCVDHQGDFDFTFPKFHDEMIKALDHRGLINPDGSIIRLDAEYDDSNN